MLLIEYFHIHCITPLQDLRLDRLKKLLMIIGLCFTNNYNFIKETKHEKECCDDKPYCYNFIIVRQKLNKCLP